MNFEIVVVWNWKERKLVHFEQVPDSSDGIDRMLELQDKYYSKIPETRKKSELELFIEDIAWIDDPKYQVFIMSRDAPSLKVAKRDFIRERSRKD